MSALVPIAMFGWPLVVLALFAALPPRRAVLASLLGAWLFLPMAAYEIAGLPDYTKMAATCLAVLLATVVFDQNRWFQLHLRWLDVPILVWCASPVATSLSNGLGIYDGLSGVLTQFVTWGAPYLIGRLYFVERAALRELALALFVGGLIYVPFCLYEIRMAPTLHHDLYGFNQHHFSQHIRWGGYRPMVFMQHGLMVAMWMATASLCGVWLWYTGALRKLWGMPMAIPVSLLLVTSVLCKSVGALILLAVGLAVLLAAKWFRSRGLLVAVFLAPMVYVCLRAPQIWYPTPLVQLSISIDEARARSLESRLHQEEVLAAKAWQRPAFGWGGYGRNRVYNEEGESEVVTDALWIIAFGTCGLVGLVSLGLVFALPALLLWRHLRVQEWWAPATAPAAVMAVCITMYAGDCLMNAMLNPIYHVMMGSVLGFAVTLAAQRKAGASLARRAVAARRRMVANAAYSRT